MTEVRYKMYLKPYWNNELTSLHEIMMNKRRVWVEDNKPNDAFSKSYKDQKHSKTTFRNGIRRNFDQYMLVTTCGVCEKKKEAEKKTNSKWNEIKRKYSKKLKQILLRHGLYTLRIFLVINQMTYLTVAFN